MYKIECVLLKQKKRPVLDITGFFFRMSTQVKAVISNTCNFFCFNNNVSNLYNNSVVEKTNGMTFNPFFLWRSREIVTVLFENDFK